MKMSKGQLSNSHQKRRRAGHVLSQKPGRWLRWLMTFALCGIVSTKAATIRDDRPDSAYRNLASSSDYQSVGIFVNADGYTGCGILIAPDWVLTAAHLFLSAGSGSFSINGDTYTSSQLIIHPDWHSANVLAGSDFGLVHLNTAVSGITPATLYTGAAESGQVGTFVGFGLTGTGLTGYTTLDYGKRAFQNVMDGDFGSPALVLGADFDSPRDATKNQFGLATPLNLEGCVAPGDSGGGVFSTFNGQSYLVGVVSAVVSTDGNSNANYGDMSAWGRVSAFDSWIGGYVPSAVPEPSLSALTTLSGLIFFARRKRTRSN